MRLRALLGSRRGWSDLETIYVVQPWTCDADALISDVSPETTAPIIHAGKPYAYFLEGFIARDFLDDLGASDDVSEANCERLISYAINDA